MGPPCFFIVLFFHRHVGTYLSLNSDLTTDVFQKSAVMATTSHAFYKSVFKDAKLSIRAEPNVMQAHMCSKDLFPIGTWPEFPASLVRKFFSTAIGVHEYSGTFLYIYGLVSLDREREKIHHQCPGT